jgi:osmotically inducible protein OsmC
MSERKGSANWQGRAKEGKGRITTESGVLKDTAFSFATRFEEDKRGTNPEELIAAAHAACFSMAFSFMCDQAGFATQEVDTSAAVNIVMKDGGFVINRIALDMTASVPGIDDAKFQELAQGAKAGCPVSKALSGVPEITLKATLRR